MSQRPLLIPVFSLMLLGPIGFAQSGASAGADQQELSILRSFGWEWSIVLPQRDLGPSDWRSWASGDVPRKGLARSRQRGVPGATVEVVDRFLDEHQEHVLELNATWAPVLARSFQMGWQSPYTGQMLSEFMTMSAANLRAPSIPSVWYNGLVPYWVQQGWGGPLGLRVTTSAPPQHMMLYPGKR